MCTNITKIKNLYTGKYLYTSCGHCEACQQEKAAHRATRIRNNNQVGWLALFITLTYDRWSVPVIYRTDLEQRLDDVPVYRLSSSRHVRVNKNYTISRKREYSKVQIDTFHIDSYPENFNPYDLPKLKNSRKKYVGICYYKDVQDFFKRLKEYTKYHCPAGQYEDYKYTYYACTEYGSTTKRPHAHALLFVKRTQASFFRSAILACWPFADRERTAKYIEVSRDAASYVASYVVKSDDLPQFFKTGVFRQKHSYSRGFGVGLDCFNLSSLLDALERRDMRYTVIQNKDGVPTATRVLIPKYVINRFFPLYKGFTTGTTSKIFDYITGAKTIFAGSRVYCPSESWKIAVRLRHAYADYKRITGKSLYDYIIDYENIWKCRYTNLLQDWYQSESEYHYIFAYDNVSDYLLGGVRSINLDEYGFRTMVVQTDPNKFDTNISKTARLEETFALKSKTKRVVNMSMAAQGHYV